MRRLIILLLVFSPFVNLAQEDAIQAIREKYYEVKQWVNATDSDSLEYSHYYHDIRIRNVNNSPWRAVGIYQDTTHYYYSDEMEAEMMDGNTNDDRAWAVAMVINSTQYSVNHEYSEYLYDKGELIFYYKKTQVTAQEDTEYRYYFSNGKLIRYMVNQKIKDNSEAEGIDWVYSGGISYLKSF